jgi:hypothetical protein
MMAASEIEKTPSSLEVGLTDQNLSRMDQGIARGSPAFLPQNLPKAAGKRPKGSQTSWNAAAVICLVQDWKMYRRGSTLPGPPSGAGIFR